MCDQINIFHNKLNGSAYSWLPSISNMVVGHFEDPWNLSLTKNMNRQRVLWIHGKWGFIFVCGQQPKDLVITWVVLVLDTLLIYFWGALRGTLLGWISGLNLSAYLGPVLVVFGSDLAYRLIELNIYKATLQTNAWTDSSVDPSEPTILWTSV